MSEKDGGPALNEREHAVLEVLANASSYDGEFGCLNFDHLTDRTGLDRKVVRRAARSLARKGLAEFHKGLWTEDGEPAGSGYCSSPAGAALAERSRTP